MSGGQRSLGVEMALPRSQATADEDVLRGQCARSSNARLLIIIARESLAYDAASHRHGKSEKARRCWRIAVGTYRRRRAA